MSKRSAPKDSIGRVAKLLKSTDNNDDDDDDGEEIHDGN